MGSGLIGFAGPDLALVKLDAPILVSRYASLPSVGMSKSLQGGAVGDVGYGVTDSARGGGQPRQVFPFRRAYATLHLSRAEGRLADTYLKLSANNPKGAFCNGDSGGPVLVGDTILAVDSIVNGRCTSSAYAYRLDTTASLAFVRGYL